MLALIGGFGGDTKFIGCQEWGKGGGVKGVGMAGIGGLEGLILGIMKWCGCPSSRDADGVIDSRIAG